MKTNTLYKILTEIKDKHELNEEQFLPYFCYAIYNIKPIDQNFRGSDMGSISQKAIRKAKKEYIKDLREYLENNPKNSLSYSSDPFIFFSESESSPQETIEGQILRLINGSKYDNKKIGEAIMTGLGEYHRRVENNPQGSNKSLFLEYDRVLLTLKKL